VSLCGRHKCLIPELRGPEPARHGSARWAALGVALVAAAVAAVALWPHATGPELEEAEAPAPRDLGRRAPAPVAPASPKGAVGSAASLAAASPSTDTAPTPTLAEDVRKRMVQRSRGEHSMQASMWTMGGALLFLSCVGTAAVPKPATGADPTAGLTSEDHAVLLDAQQRIRQRRGRLIAELLRIVRDERLRRENRAAVIVAIQLLGDLRAKEAAPVLAGLLRFGYRGELTDSHFRRIPDHPHKRGPAVKALIQIGVPSIEPVAEQLLAMSKATEHQAVLQRHCLWVIRGVLGPDLATEYLKGLIETDERAKDNDFVKQGLRFMELYDKAKGGLMSDL